jgi:phage terminase small subunit
VPKKRKDAARSLLTPKQERFVLEYMIDMNATQAAIRAGYSKKTAGQIGEQNLKKLEIKQAVAKVQAKTSDKLEITRERWLKELSCSAFIDIRDLYEDDGSIKLVRDMPENARRAIAGFEVAEIFDRADGDQKSAIGLLKKVRLIQKNNSLELIGKHLGFLGDRAEGEVNITADGKKFVIEVRHTKPKSKPE